MRDDSHVRARGGLRNDVFDGADNTRLGISGAFPRADAMCALMVLGGCLMGTYAILTLVPAPSSFSHRG
jgi:hypothetical protein